MPKRTLAALCVVLAFAAVLVVVPASTDTADAHTRTKTVQRCAYDPFAGQQCWNETVNVSHVHRCGAGLTGTYPNCYPIPPATQPVCPAGMTGTPPNCYPPPPATTEPPPPPTTQPPPPPTTAPPPPPTTQPPPPPPTTQPPPPPTTQPPKCPAGQTGTPPNCKTERDTQRCATGYHRYGTGCHANHDYSRMPCGTGTWAPHAGHTPKQQASCEPRKKDEDEAEKNGCTKKVAAGYPAAVEHHRHMLAGHMTGCHPAVANNHCQDGEHAHTHAGACHRNNVNVPSLERHCSSGEHQHKHGEGHCHPRDTPHCEDGEHYHYATHTRNSTDGNARCHDVGNHPWLHEECGDGQHNHRDKVFPRVKGCHDEHTQHNTGDLSKTAEYVYDATGEIVCTVVGSAAVKVAKLVQKSVSELKKFLTNTGIDAGVGVGCGALWDRFVKEEARDHEADKKNDHDEHNDDDTGDANTDDEDDDSDSDSDSDGGPSTTEGPPKPDSDSGSDDDSDDGQDGTGCNPAKGDTCPDDDDVAEAEAKWRRGEIGPVELFRIQNARDCAKGYPWAKNCE